MSETLAILVVDDNQSMANSLRDVLELKGFTAYAANSGAKALEILREQPVDILVTDVIMPEMNGIMLNREAKKTHPYITTILMTAYSADDLIQKGMQEGIKTVLNKPMDIELLVQMLKAFEKTGGKAG